MRKAYWITEVTKHCERDINILHLGPKTLYQSYKVKDSRAFKNIEGRPKS